MPKSHKLPNDVVVCPNCGHKLNGATGVTTDDAIPKEGDLSVCFGCAAILEYEEGFFVHLFSDKQLEALMLTDNEIYRQLIGAQQSIREYRATLN